MGFLVQAGGSQLVLHQLCLECTSSHHPTGHYYSSLAWHRTELVVGTLPENLLVKAISKNDEANKENDIEHIFSHFGKISPRWEKNCNKQTEKFFLLGAI